jgi:hypothetical protein
MVTRGGPLNIAFMPLIEIKDLAAACGYAVLQQGYFALLTTANSD